jgi:hypothetical protein
MSVLSAFSNGSSRGCEGKQIERIVIIKAPPFQNIIMQWYVNVPSHVGNIYIHFFTSYVIYRTLMLRRYVFRFL